ncbi:MAG TPA: pyruvate dehydrogenase complex E1 component subunit beta [Bacteroidetes bacterium]|nr:MAG: pyruvate dehydrogenase [Ignavibacteria bacterium GWA2_54_16]HCA81815.1 pyruvate dehydrogenase complex E1 component subunit beta [Bacteroidota bacterium]
MAIVSLREAINQAIDEEMARDESVFLMGEEVANYQGAYKVSQGLLQKWGPKRILDTPIAEAGFAGLGVGAAMVGLRPIVEFMTWNFSLVAYDQIANNAAKMYSMSGGNFHVPIVFRGPGGAAHGLGATHSQSLESIYAHIPGLKVVMPSTCKDAKGLLKTSIRDDNPIVFIESEVMYGDKGEIPDGEYTIPLGVGEVKKTGSDVTIVSWSKVLANVVWKAVDSIQEELNISIEVIDPRTIKPMDYDLIVESVKKTNRLVIVEEGWPFAGIGAQISHEISSRAFDHLDAPVERVTQEDVPLPYAHQLEIRSLPSVEKINAAVKKVLYRD